jgi:hypothetical protein
MLLRLTLLFAAMVVSPLAARADAVEDAEKAILDLYDSGKLFPRANYKAVRAAFADLFEARHDATIRQAFGDDYEALNKWLTAHVELKQTFYTAIDEKHDDVRRALEVFRQIWKLYPDKLDKWGSLAIAISVVWDVPGRGVYDFRQHQVRAKSKLPSGQLDALENFKYLVDAEKKLVHQTHLYPWEFLTFVVDHRTPSSEREWSFGYYQKAKGTVRSWHQDVPYDMNMLKGEITKGSAEPNLMGKDYTLANIRQFGGVCAHQADFAARTAKSLGVPAVYCWGASAYRGLHAWWMYVHVTAVTKDEIKFSLVSDGRYEGFARDQFYTGTVTDPQTGRDLLDRDLERRLWLTGSDRVGKRMTALLARAYPLVLAQRDLTIQGKVTYLDKMLKVNKYDDFAWQSLSEMASKGELKADQKKLVLGYVQSMNETFAKSPDFIARIFEPMLEVIPGTPEKIKLFEQAVNQYEKAQRPDLACDARLKMTERLVADKKMEAAGKGVVSTIRKFPTEGRFVPKLAAKLEDLAPQYKGGVQQTGELYLELLPAMILHYRNPNDEYYRNLEKQAKAFLTRNNQKQILAQLETRIAAASAQVKQR